MRSAALCLVVALFGAVVAEPPSGYSYSRPSGGFSGGFSGGLSGGLSGGGAYQQVSHSGQTSEGQNLDHGLLEQIKQVLLRDESSSGGGHGGGFGGGYSSGGISSSYGAPSSSYSAPSSSYGAPSPSSSYGAPSFGGGRVTGLDLEGIQQAIQVAQFTQQSSSGGGGGGYPSSSYGAPSRPSSSYGAPF